MAFIEAIHGIDLSGPGWDMYVLLIFILGIAFYLLKWGKGRAFWITVSAYGALALAGRLPLIEKVTGLELSGTFMQQTLFFLVAILGLYSIFIRSDFVMAPTRSPKGAWFQTLIMSFLQLGFLTSTILTFLPAAEAGELSIFLRMAFLDGGAQFFWLLSPLVAILLLKDK